MTGYKNLTECNGAILTKGVPRSWHKIYLQSRQVREASIYTLVIFVIMHSSISKMLLDLDKLMALNSI